MRSAISAIRDLLMEMPPVPTNALSCLASTGMASRSAAGDGVDRVPLKKALCIGAMLVGGDGNSAVTLSRAKGRLGMSMFAKPLHRLEPGRGRAYGAMRTPSGWQLHVTHVAKLGIEMPLSLLVSRLL